MVEEDQEAARLGQINLCMSAAPLMVYRLEILFVDGWGAFSGRPFVLWFDLVVSHCIFCGKIFLSIA